jgi:Family of unknown function (DUF6188)
VKLVPYGPPEALGAALALLHQTVTELHVSNMSDLRVTFSDGSTVEARADADHAGEPWNITGRDGLLVVAPPSGGDPAVLWGGGATRMAR